MDAIKLVEMAAASVGGKSALARQMGKPAPRISEWASGRQTPNTHELAYLAETAGLPVLETVAEIEAQLDPRYSRVWTDALAKLRAAGVAASVIAVVGGMTAPTPSHAQAIKAGAVYIM